MTSNLAARQNVVASPIVVPPSQYFEGIDGSWSTLNVRVGNPAQSVRVIVSTNSPQTIVVQPAGCADTVFPRGVPPNCIASRGGVFNINESDTWISQGWYSLNNKDTRYGFEANLGYNFNLNYGLDSLGLDYQAGPNGPTLENQTVAAYNLPNPLYHGLFGLGTQPVLYDTFGNYSAPSYFQSLRTENMIPSLSWSYTAGASYRLSAGQYAQLIFGGFDSSRFQPNDVQFRLSADVTRDIVVGVQSILLNGANTTALLPSPIYAFIESTDPNIWLPLEACLLFEQAFGITWDNKTSKYLINDTVYNNNLATKPSVTFRLGVSTTGGSTTNIVLPFEALALRIQYPFTANATRYFPLRRAANETQYTLGRTFLQEAYLTVDYERDNFTVSQCTFNQGAAQVISTIHSPNTTQEESGETGSKSAPVGAIAGGVAGGIVVIILIGLLVWLRRRKRRQSGTPQRQSSTPIEHQNNVHGDVVVDGYQEADDDHWIKRHEIGSAHTVPEKEQSTRLVGGEIGGNEIYQMPAPTRGTNDLDRHHEMAANKENDTIDPAASLLNEPKSTEQPARSKTVP